MEHPGLQDGNVPQRGPLIGSSRPVKEVLQRDPKTYPRPRAVRGLPEAMVCGTVVSSYTIDYLLLGVYHLPYTVCCRYDMLYIKYDLTYSRLLYTTENAPARKPHKGKASTRRSPCCGSAPGTSAAGTASWSTEGLGAYTHILYTEIYVYLFMCIYISLHIHIYVYMCVYVYIFIY